MKKTNKEPNFLDTKKRTNPLKILAVIFLVVVVIGVISYATNYANNEANRHRTVEDVINAMEERDKSVLGIKDSSETNTDGTAAEETTTEVEEN